MKWSGTLLNATEEADQKATSMVESGRESQTYDFCLLKTTPKMSLLLVILNEKVCLI
jgi:hypothetical protein